MPYLPFTSLRKALLFFFDTARLSATAINYEPHYGSNGIDVDERLEIAASIGFYLSQLSVLEQYILKCRYGYLYTRHDTVKSCRDAFRAPKINIHNITIYTKQAERAARLLLIESGILKKPRNILK